jgi:hypothetical protein
MTDEEPCCAAGREEQRPFRDENDCESESSGARFSTALTDTDDDRTTRMVHLDGGTF